MHCCATSEFHSVLLACCAGYGYLAYKDAGKSTAPRPSSILQPAILADKKWDSSQIMSFKPHPVLLNPASDPAKAAQYVAPAAPLPSFKMPGKEPAQRFIIQSTQPLVESNGMMRWALDSIASPTGEALGSVMYMPLPSNL